MNPPWRLSVTHVTICAMDKGELAALMLQYCGLRVIWVDALDESVILVEGEGIVLADAILTADAVMSVLWDAAARLLMS